MSINITNETGMPNEPVIGIWAPCDPRIDDYSRDRAKNIIQMVADKIDGEIKLPNGKPVKVVFSQKLVDGEAQADEVARQLKAHGVNILLAAPDTWAFPQLTMMSLLAHFPADTPVCMVSGNSGPRPGVVYTHATSGALAQSGRLAHIIVGFWADSGSHPEMSEETTTNLVDWLFAAVTFKGLQGRRVALFGHDSMGMETALPHIAATRNSFGLEVTRLDMKLLADMLNKEAYDKVELEHLKNWLNGHAKDRIELVGEAAEQKLAQSLAMYLIHRDLLRDLDAVGGGFMSQLEWGSDLRGLPLPVADIMESLFNSTFDHNGKKPVMPFATEADAGALLTMVIFTWLAGGTPPLFMDFRKVWEPWELNKLAQASSVKLDENEVWVQKGLVDGNNSGSGSFDWAALPGTSEADIMSKISFPHANDDYFPGGGNSVTYISPAGIEGIAGRLAYSSLSGMFSLVWDEAVSVHPGDVLAKAISETSSPTWPHTYLTPRFATMMEYKHYAPANHLHMNWGLNPARVQYWMDLANVLSSTPWASRPSFIEGVDRPQPLLYVINGGEDTVKLMRKK